MLSLQLERLRQVSLCDRLVVASTTNKADDAIDKFCQNEGVDCIRGSESDVLSRFVKAAKFFGATSIVRLTGDCPLIEPTLVDNAIKEFLEAKGAVDYVSNMIEPSWPYGMAVEVMSVDALLQAHAHALSGDEREHVTPYLYRNPHRFRLKSLVMKPNLKKHRWTVDTPEDFELVRRIFTEIYPKNQNFRMSDVLAVLEANPEWIMINSHIIQKQVANQRS
jgi:spore coat polysaccharide biosynthesis protein SpsF